jgi:predicted MFS family arabinose efflux permease
MWVGIGIFGVLFNLYLLTIGFNVAFVGALAAVSTVGQASVSPVLGRLLRHWSARAVMLVATAVAALTMAASALFTPAVPLALVTALLGAAIAAASIPASPFIMEQAPAAQRPHLFSAYSASATFGSMAGSLISGVLPAISGVLPFLGGRALVQDRAGLLLGAAITAVGIWSLWRITDERVEEAAPSRPAGAPDSGLIAQDETRRDVLAMMAATALIALALGLVYPLFNVYFATVHHASTSTIGLIYTISGVFSTAGALLGPLAARLGTLRGLVIMRLLSAPMLLLFWAQPGLAIAFLAFVSRNILGQITGTLENTFAMEVVPAPLRGAVSSWRTFAFNAGWTAGSLVAGVVVARFGFNSVFVASAALTVAGSLTWYRRFGRGGTRIRFPLRGADGEQGE